MEVHTVEPDPYLWLSSIYDGLKSGDDYDRVADLALAIASDFDLRPELAVDAATGTGNLAVQLASRGLTVLGIDASAAML